MAGKIAPHEGRELELIAAGKKDFAVIEERKNPRAYHRAGGYFFDNPRVSVLYIENDEGPEVIVSTKREKIEEYENLLLSGIERLGVKNFHRAMGRLFGYSAADIEAFIAAEIACNCSKCTGRAGP